MNKELGTDAAVAGTAGAKSEPAEVKMVPKKRSVVSVVAGWIVIFAIIGVVIYGLVYYEGPLPWEASESEVLEPANVELYRFSPLISWNNVTNETLNVEIWLKNTGEVVARDVSLFIRVRDQNGDIEYMDMPDLTWELLGWGETCSAVYVVDYGPGDAYVEHTIELRWDSGMNSYLRRTDLG